MTAKAGRALQLYRSGIPARVARLAAKAGRAFQLYRSGIPARVARLADFARSRSVLLATITGPPQKGMGLCPRPSSTFKERAPRQNMDFSENGPRCIFPKSLQTK